ncbi:hypothetical protein [Streptomyces aureocirculatus]|uniref:hypothetical protein n=1 Tax=Streptomyces aureocirculatus TaxID=67275 RepID=UPI0004CA4ACC|nr:hypothetical protein [Streptomyces aureocirculatus]
MSKSDPTTRQWLRTAAVRVHTGSSRLVLHAARRAIARARALYTPARAWLSRSSGLKWCAKVALLIAAAAITRKIGTVILGGAYRQIASGAWWGLLWTAAIVWVIAAYRVGHPGWKPKQPVTPEAGAKAEGQAEDTDAQEKTEAPPAQPHGPLPVSPVGLVAAVRDIGTPNAQLVPLAAHLGTTTDAVRAAAATLGWPVKDVRMEGRSASAGLRWDEAPTPPPLAPSSTGVAAGHAADDNDDDNPEEGGRKGTRVRHIGQGGRVVTDPAETVRHHKITG